MDIDRVQTALDDAFVTTGADTPGWPDPRPDGGSPPEYLYSRCLDPARYAIIRSRVLAWVHALVSLGLADLAAAPPGPGESWLLRPRRPGALPMLLTCRSQPDGPLHMAIGLGDPPVQVDTLPACACDACDGGSAPFLTEVDDGILDVISGAFARVQAPGLTVTGARNGYGMSGDLDTVTDEQVAALLADARAGRSRYPTIHGACWWDD